MNCRLSSNLLPHYLAKFQSISYVHVQDVHVQDLTDCHKNKSKTQIIQLYKSIYENIYTVSVCHTDGSQLQRLGRMGASVFNQTTNLKLTLPLGKYSTVFQAEIYAILACARNDLSDFGPGIFDALSGIHFTQPFRTLARIMVRMRAAILPASSVRPACISRFFRRSIAFTAGVTYGGSDDVTVITRSG